MKESLGKGEGGGGEGYWEHVLKEGERGVLNYYILDVANRALRAIIIVTM